MGLPRAAEREQGSECSAVHWEGWKNALHVAVDNPHAIWPRAYYQSARARGMPRQASLRALAFNGAHLAAFPLS